MTDIDRTFFIEAYDRLFPKVTAYVIARCAAIGEVEDVVQEVFTELYAVILKKGRGYIGNADAFAMHIAKTKVAKHYKKAIRLRLLLPTTRLGESGEYDYIEDTDIDVEQQYLNRETVAAVKEILNGKPIETQKIFALYYYSGRTIKEISKDLSVGESFVKHRLYGTLEEIRAIYKKDGNSL